MSLSLVGPPLLRLLAAAWPAPFLHTTTSKFKEVDAARGHSSWTPNHLPLYTSKQRHGQDWIWWPSSSVIRFAESSDGRRLQTVRQQLTPSNDNRTTRRISPVLSFILKFRIQLKSKDRHRNSSTRRSFWNYMTGSRWKRRRLPDPVVRRVSARQKFYRRDRCHAERNLLRIRNLASPQSPPHPRPVFTTMLSVGRCTVLLCLVAMATDVENFYAAVNALGLRGQLQRAGPAGNGAAARLPDADLPPRTPQ